MDFRGNIRMADLFKKCNACKSIKHIMDFNKRKRSKDGHDGICRACLSDHRRQEYQLNKEKIKENASKYYYKNRHSDEFKKKRNAYYHRRQGAKSTHKCACGCGATTNNGRKYLRGHYNKVREYSKEYRLQMSVVKKNITEETRCKMSESAKKSPFLQPKIKRLTEMTKQRRGEKHPNWLGGISFEHYGRGWNKTIKEKVMERDGKKCQNPGCLGKSKRINIHHIDYNKKNHNIDNLITLCTSCHCMTNFNRIKWQEFYIDIIRTKRCLLEVCYG